VFSPFDLTSHRGGLLIELQPADTDAFIDQTTSVLALPTSHRCECTGYIVIVLADD